MSAGILLEPCCSRCTHSPSRPCADLLACIQNGPLCHDDPDCRAARILILAGRSEGLQSVVDRAAGAGVRGFLNFVPKITTLPTGCFIEQVDISGKLEKLSFLSRDEGR